MRMPGIGRANSLDELAPPGTGEAVDELGGDLLDPRRQLIHARPA